MDVVEHIAALRDEGARLADAAAAAGPDALVPTCPDWRVRDLVTHVGQVHRWATVFISEPRAEPPDAELQTRIRADVPADDASLLAWFRDGHAALQAALGSAPPDVQCWTFFTAPSPLAFWARRQAHETAIHRADADAAAARPTTYDAEFAADGIDELLAGFVTRSRTPLVSDPPRSLAIATTDTAAGWLVLIEPDGRQILRTAGTADCRVEGPASDLYLALWNRGGSDALTVTGDAQLLADWATGVRIRWG